MPGDPAAAPGPEDRREVRRRQTQSETDNSQAPDLTARNEEPGHLQRIEATASAAARIYQAGRDQHIAERDLHLHYTDGMVEAHSVVPDDKTVTSACPYPGLLAFEEDQTQWFFGREQLIAEMVSRLDDQLHTGGALVVAAASGAGKTSALKAGLLPALARGALPAPGSSRWPRLLLTPTADPVGALTTRLAEALVLDPHQVAGPGAAVPRSWATAVRAALGAAADGQGQRLRDRRLVIVVDQLEELFTVCESEPDRHDFLDLLASLALADPRGGPPAALVVFGLRSDFYTSCARYPQLRAALSHGQVLVAPLDEAELRQAILFPARSVGLDIEPGLVELLLRDLGVPAFRTGTNSPSPTEDSDLPHPEGSVTPGAENYEAGRLPLLAHALRVTWQQRHGHTLTVDGYRTTGGIHQAVATTAERLFTVLEPAAQQTARTVFLRLVKLGDGVDDTRRPLSHDQVQAIGGDPASTAAVIEAFTRGRLLTRRWNSVEITHEALLHAWPRLRRWIDTDRAGHLAHQQLEEVAASWAKASHDSGMLYRGHRLEAARAWADGPHRESLSTTGARFLATSARHQRRATRLRRTLTAVVTVLALIASTAAVVALQQRTTARAQRDAAVFSRITAEADKARLAQSPLAAQLDLVAHQMRPSDAAVRLHLAADANGPLATPLPAHPATVGSVAYSPAGRIIASDGDKGDVRLWDVTRATQPKALNTSLKCDDAATTTVAWAVKGHLLACGSTEGKVRLWGMTDPAHPVALGKPLAANGMAVAAAAFSPDGHAFAAVGGDHKMRIWRVGPAGATGAPAELLVAGLLPEHNMWDVAFSPDSDTLAVGIANGEVRLWDVADPARPKALGNPLAAFVDSGSARSVAFTPDGGTLAVGGSEGTIRFWDLRDRARPKALGKPLIGHVGAVQSLAFNTAGDTLASGGEDCQVRLWDVRYVESPAPLGTPLAGHTTEVTDVAFHPDGRTLTSSGRDGNILLWTLPASVLPDDSIGSQSLAFSPRGPSLLVGTGNGETSVWSLANPFRPRLVNADTTAKTGLAIALSPSGRILAGGTLNRAVQLWDATDPTHLTPLGKPLIGHKDALLAVRFSPDGHALASIDAKGTVRLWNITDPRHIRLAGSPLTGHPEHSTALSFSPDGRTLAVPDRDFRIRMWDVTDLTHPRHGKLLTGHRLSVRALAFTLDGRTLASAANDATVRLWDVSDRTHPKVLGKPLTGHTGDVAAIAVSPDGHLLATGGTDRTIRLWDITNPAHPTAVDHPLTGLREDVFTLAFSKDGRSLVSGALVDSLRLWHLDPEDNKRHICDTTRAVLTRAAWRQHLSGLAFAPPCT